MARASWRLRGDGVYRIEPRRRPRSSAPLVALVAAFTLLLAALSGEPLHLLGAGALVAAAVATLAVRGARQRARPSGAPPAKVLALRRRPAPAQPAARDTGR